MTTPWTSCCRPSATHTKLPHFPTVWWPTSQSFTREVTKSATNSDTYSIKDYAVYQNAFLVTKETITVTSKNYPTITGSDNIVMKTGKTHNFALPQADMYLMQFKAAFPTVSFLPAATVVTTPSSTPKLLALKQLGFLFVLPTSVLPVGDVTFAVGGVSNVNYLPLTTAESTIQVMATAGYKLTTYNLDTSAPTPLWKAEATVFDPVLAPGEYGTYDGNVYSDSSDSHTLTVKFANTAVPKGGAFAIDFPSQYVSVSAIVFSDQLTASCTGSVKRWLCTTSAVIALNTAIEVTGRAKLGVATVTSHFVITAYFDAAATQIIAQNTAAGTVT